MSEDITIKKVERKTSKTGKEYLSILADKGKYSCWSVQVFSQIVEGNKIRATIKENTVGNTVYKDILGVEAVLGSVQIDHKEARDDKMLSMREAYTKDIFVALLNKTATPFDAIELAKLAVQCINVIKDGVNEVKKEVEKKEEFEDLPI